MHVSPDTNSMFSGRLTSTFLLGLKVQTRQRIICCAFRGLSFGEGVTLQLVLVVRAWAFERHEANQSKGTRLD